MALFEIKMPKMGESIEEATITKWFVKEGDQIQEDDVLLEIATDKVDSEIPSPVAGKIVKIFFEVNDLVPVGKVIALIDTEDGVGTDASSTAAAPVVEETKRSEAQPKTPLSKAEYKEADARFYSPLVRSIAAWEQIPPEELSKIHGTGRNNRVRKQDILAWIQSREKHAEEAAQTDIKSATETIVEKAKPSVSLWPGDEVMEMDRVRKIIADHMVMSKRTAAHVTNILEADVTEIVMWRNRVKDEFEAREKQKFTFMPPVTQAVARALRDFPGVNITVDGYNIIMRKAINIGIAVATPDGNLIVPVVKNADQLSLTGLALEINRLAELARKGKLSPDDIQGGTFSITNFGTFRNLMGTPVINQPQAAILAVGVIEKKPAVLETPGGDVIAIRHKMYLSLSYDHRAIDGALGGAFLRRVADYLEKFDTTAKV